MVAELFAAKKSMNKESSYTSVNQTKANGF